METVTGTEIRTGSETEKGTRMGSAKETATEMETETGSERGMRPGTAKERAPP